MCDSIFTVTITTTFGTKLVCMEWMPAGLEIKFLPRSNSAPGSKILGVNLVQQGAENVFIMTMGQKLKEQMSSNQLQIAHL